MLAALCRDASHLERASEALRARASATQATIQGLMHLRDEIERFDEIERSGDFLLNSLVPRTLSLSLDMHYKKNIIVIFYFFLNICN